MTKTTSKHLQALKKIAENKYDNALKATVAQDALDSQDGEYAIGYLQDVCTHGCVSGSCSGLIYYTDTHAFYNKHADEIDTILQEYEEITGEAFKFEGKDVRNTLAWMGYEETARAILSELNIEI